MDVLSDTQLDDLADCLADRVVARLVTRMARQASVGSSATPSDEATSSTAEWLTAAEAARYLGFRTIKAFYSAVERGQVPGSHLGRRLRFHRAGLDRLLSGRAARMAPRVPSPGRESERW